MDELNRRKAVVYTHPTTANCCRNLVPSVPPALIEYGTDTTRAIASILLSRHRQEVSRHQVHLLARGRHHAVPDRAVRPARAAGERPGWHGGGAQDFHYDIAQASHPIPLGALVKLVSTSQIVFGTDFPFRTAADHAKALVEFGFTPDELRAIDRENALKLLPKYRA